MNATNETKTGSQPHLRDAFMRVRPRMAALKDSELLKINVDAFTAVAVARAALPRLRTLRPRLEKLSDFDLTSLDLLEDYALALLQAESVYRGKATRSQELTELLNEGFALRARLVADLQVLTKRALMPPASLAKLNVPNGYRTIGADLLTIAALLRERWASIEKNTAIQLSELERAELLGEDLIGAIVLREHASTELAAAGDDRTRAFTLFMRAYRQVRRAVVYLRQPMGDADRFAPSLYRRRRSSRKDAVSATETTEATVNQATKPTDAPRPLDQSSEPDVQGCESPIVDPFIH